jgi:hypothetical protein
MSRHRIGCNEFVLFRWKYAENSGSASEERIYSGNHFAIQIHLPTFIFATFISPNGLEGRV